MSDPSLPKRFRPRISAAPKIRSTYWCDFPEDAHLPQLWKTRPVIVISSRNKLHGAVTILPMTTASQEGNEWAVQTQTSVDGRLSWAICDKPSTVATSRLSPVQERVPRLSVDDFEKSIGRLLGWLPKRALRQE